YRPERAPSRAAVARARLAPASRRASPVCVPWREAPASPDQLSSPASQRNIASRTGRPPTVRWRASDCDWCRCRSSINLSGRNGIEAGRAAKPGDRMAARQSARSEQSASARAVGLNRLDGILRAAWLESAGRWKQRRDEKAIEADRRDQHRRGPAALSHLALAQRASPARPSLTWAARNASARS